MDAIIKQSISKGITYQEYKNIVTELINDNSNSGAEKSQDLADYTKLNQRRMKRWDKTLKITEEATAKIKAFNKSVTFLIITESWCGDAAHVLPILDRIANLNANINTKIVFRDVNLELMDMFLTNGGRAIAKVIIIDNETNEVLNTFGPRPSEATKLVNDYKDAHGKLTPEFKEDLQQWYNKNKGQNIIEDFVEIFKEIELVV